MKKTESKWFSPILARVWGFSDTTKKKGVQKWRFFFAPNEVWWYNAVTAGAVGRAKKWKIGIVIAIMEENMFWWQKIMWIFFLEVFRKKVGKNILKKNIFGSHTFPKSATIGEILHLRRLARNIKSIKYLKRDYIKSTKKII